MAKVSSDASLAGANRYPLLAPSATRGASSSSNPPKKGPARSLELAPDNSPQAPDMDRVCVELSQLIGFDVDDVRSGGLEREDIAEACGVSVARINKWTAPSKPDHLPPVQYLPLWVRATGSTRLLKWAAESCGYTLATPADMRAAELGRKVQEAAAAILAEVAA